MPSSELFPHLAFSIMSSILILPPSFFSFLVVLGLNHHTNGGANKTKQNKKPKPKNLCQWLILVILATWEAEIGRIKVRGQPQQVVPETPISKITEMDWRCSSSSRVPAL
jgi:hypothetical protein